MIPVCREPFSKPRGWLTWGLLGMALSPLVIGITVTIVSYAGYEVSSNLQSACTRGLSRLTLLTALSEAVTYFVFLCLLPYAALHDCMLNTSNRSRIISDETRAQKHLIEREHNRHDLGTLPGTRMSTSLAKRG